tara:strand:- start:24367 stop:24615 length:249 start_codon:yes stop_codon:yes gene_type:complete
VITDNKNINILKDIAKEMNLNLNDEDIYSIVDFQYESIKGAMEEKRFIELPYFGRFFVKEGRDKYLESDKRFYEPHIKDISD